MSSSVPQAPKKAKLSILLLAAGSSSRLGQAKQLLPFKNTTLVYDRVATISKAFGGKYEVLVVTGARRQEVMKSISKLPFKEVFNKQFPDGMSSSLRAGLQNLSASSDAALILLVDQPFISEQHLLQMASKWLSTPDKVVAASYAGILGVPAIFPRKYFNSLMSLKGDQGARKILKNLPGDEVSSYPLPEASIDIDTLEDLKALGI